MRADLGLETLADLLDKIPATATQLAAARDGLAAQGAPAADGAALSDALGAHARQRTFLNVVQKKKHAALKQHLSTEGKAWLEGCGGPGAGAFLLYPEDANCSMEDELWSTALRQRLGLERAEYKEQEALPEPAPTRKPRAQPADTTLTETGCTAPCANLGEVSWCVMAPSQEQLLAC